jgi:hypothetical protein
VPDNAGFYHLAYAAAAVIYSAYAFSIHVRRKRLKQRKRE